MLRKFAPFYFLFALFLVGCETVGFTNAPTLDQKIAYAYGQVAAVRLATASSLNSGAISSAEAEDIQQQADVARQTLDAAHLALNAGDPSTADGRLSAAISILTTLRAYLNSKAAP